MRRNKLLRAIVCMILLLGISSCAGTDISENIAEEHFEEESKEQVTEEKTTENANALHIGVSMQGLQRNFIRRVKEAMLQAEAEYHGEIELIILDGQEDAERQNAQIEKLITQQVDAIIFNPISYEEGAIGVRLANESGIPIVMLTTTVDPEIEPASAYAISDHKESAYIQMDMAAQYLDYSGNIAILKGKKGIDSEIARTRGYEEKLLEYSGLNVVCSQVANWSTDEAREIVENWLRTGKEIDVILAQNDIMAIGALQAVKEAGKEGKIAIFGIDGDAEALRYVKRGELQGTVYHDAELQGKNAVEYAVKLARGESINWEYIPFRSIDLSNVEDYLDLGESLE